jgi:hypothetical protein
VYLVTRFQPDTRSLRMVLGDGFPERTPRERFTARRALTGDLGVWLRRVHAVPLYHNDCSAKNVLVRDTGRGFEFLLLDLESVSRWRAPGHRRRVKNLAQLLEPPFRLARTDILRVLNAYSAGMPAHERARLRRDVAARILYRRGRRLLRQEG